jgi:hypothetical protein
MASILIWYEECYGSIGDLSLLYTHSFSFDGMFLIIDLVHSEIDIRWVSARSLCHRTLHRIGAMTQGLSTLTEGAGAMNP